MHFQFSKPFMPMIGLVTLLLPAPAIAQLAVRDLPAAITTDPPADLAHPASTLAVEIPSHGSVMNGMVYRPAGAGPFPLVVLMHGLPGNEQNMDLAQALRRAGWAVMTFHYRGCFGSEGRFSIDHALEDADVAVAWAARPESARAWNIDPARIVVIGHSMGGLAAAHSAGRGPKRLATILVAPWDPSTLATLLRPMSPSARLATAQDRWGDVSHGRLTGISSNQIAQQIIDHGERWRLADAASGLAKSPLLVVTASRDLASSKAGGLKAALHGDGATFDTAEISSNHTFDDRRIELETVVLDWLARFTSPAAPPKGR